MKKTSETSESTKRTRAAHPKRPKHHFGYGLGLPNQSIGCLFEYPKHPKVSETPISDISETSGGSIRPPDSDIPAKGRNEKTEGGKTPPHEREPPRLQ